MSATSPLPHTATQPWYREPWPWFLMSLPITAVLAGIVTTVYAVRTNDGVVADDYYKQGLAINQTLARDDMAAQLGLQARLDVRDGVAQVLLRGREGVSLPAELRLMLSHPTRQGDDQQATLRREGDVYRGALTLRDSGLRTVILEDASRSWRLSASVQLPAQGAELLPRMASPTATVVTTP
ncbi:MAG: FixH family protein [Rhodocyclaceae bacterium]